MKMIKRMTLILTPVLVISSVVFAIFRSKRKMSFNPYGKVD